MADDSLSRFFEAQYGIYSDALAELRAGRKQGHWMWFIFPQIAGLGTSAMSRHYAIRSKAEAHAYLTDPVLGTRLRECTQALLQHAGRDAESILGVVDATKLGSSMTLFEQVAAAHDLFGVCLATFFDGVRDPATLRLLDIAH